MGQILHWVRKTDASIFSSFILFNGKALNPFELSQSISVELMSECFSGEGNYLPMLVSQLQDSMTETARKILKAGFHLHFIMFLLL